MDSSIQFEGAGTMEFLLILTSPFWPLALLAGIDRFNRLSAEGPREPVRRVLEPVEAFDEQEDFHEQAAAPPRFFMRPANFAEIARERAALSHERARRMGM